MLVDLPLLLQPIDGIPYGLAFQAVAISHQRIVDLGYREWVGRACQNLYNRLCMVHL